MMTVNMRRIVAAEFVSLDGVMEAPDAWHGAYVDDEVGAATAAQMAEWEGRPAPRPVGPTRSSLQFGPADQRSSFIQVRWRIS